MAGTQEEKGAFWVFAVEDGSIAAPSILYHAADKNFPAADMFWTEEEPVGNGRHWVFCIQFILADKRPKPLSTYTSFFEHLRLDREKDEVVIYFVTNQSFTEKYAESDHSIKFIEGKGKIIIHII